VASHARKETVTSDEEILKNKGDCTIFQKDATFFKFQSGNQFDEEDEIFRNLQQKNVPFFTSPMKIFINYYY
jgi:hypothetical protein